MVQTRRKTAAAAQDGAVKENKVEPLTPQTPTKKGKRGRPPKVKNEPVAVNSPSTSASNDVSTLPDQEESVNCAQEEEIALFNESNNTTVNSDQNDKETSSSISVDICTNSVTTAQLPRKRSNARRKTDEEEDLSQEFVAQEVKTEVPEPTSPAHPDDPQPSSVFTMETSTSEVANSLVEPTLEISTSSSTSIPASVLKVEEELVLAEPRIKQEVEPIAPINEESDTMDIADSESDGENDLSDEEDVLKKSKSSLPQPESEAPRNIKKEEIHVDIDTKISNHGIGLSPWDRSEEKATCNPLSSPTISRPRIHFLHPAYSSFANDPSCVSPQSSSTETTSFPVSEKAENGIAGAFKMTFKKGMNNTLLKSSALDQHPTSQPTSSSASASEVSKMEPTVPPPKRSSNFGMSASSELPPPQMVELPKLSFFNAPSAASSSLSEIDESENRKCPKLITPVALTTPTKYSESDIQALRAKADKVAKDIARRHEGDRHNQGRDDYDRRRDERDRRYKRGDSEHRSEQQIRSRQREDDERRAREREREVTKRHDREREEERVQRQKDEEKRKRDEDSFRRKEEDEIRQKEEERRRKDEERRQKDEEKRLKEEEEAKLEEEKRIKEEEAKTPNFDPITECVYMTKNANKKRTESLECECYRTGGNCSDNTCVNRAMLTECPSSCRAKCKNQRFAKRKYAAVEAFHTGTAKGFGLRALKDIKEGRFIIEYIGEVLEREDYEKRKIKYAADKKHKHHYLCDTGVYTIDATVRGNISRFVNHSCDPNAICEKWSVPKTPGDISRIGFFCKRFIKAGEEISFDYQFVNYGREAQQCFCGASTCNGWIGRKAEECSSDEDENDIVTTRDIDLDEEEEEKLEELDELEPHERIELIRDMLDDLVIKNKKHAKKVITIATRITDHNQRENLLKEIFSSNTPLSTQSFYAQNGMATLMGEWLEADDYSLVNLKLVQVILQTLHDDVFVPCAKADPYLLEVLSHWRNSSLGDWVDIHVVANSLVMCTVDPKRNYESVGDNIQKEIRENFKRVKDMAALLSCYWFNRSVSFKIPKKIREPVKDSTIRPENSVSSSQGAESSRSSHDSTNNQRNHHSYSNSYYDDRESHPRFFNNGNDVHQYRFTGYHGNNYKANYLPRRRSKDSYRDRRRHRSRSRSRSVSPYSHKRRRVDDRESQRGRSPGYERRAVSPDEKPSVSHKSADRGYSRSDVQGVASVNPSVEEVDPHVSHIYPPEHQRMQPVPYHPYPYGQYDPHYMYAANPAYYPPAFPPDTVALAMGNFPPSDKLRDLYEKATIDQLTERLESVKEELEILHQELAAKHLERKRLETIHRQAEEEESRSKYTWGIARAAEGEIYYYNKITKETQWTLPTPEQGTCEPSTLTPVQASVTTSEDNEVIQQQNHTSEGQDAFAVKEELVDQSQQIVVSRHAPVRSVSPASSRERREGSRHREITKNSFTSEQRIKKFKNDLEQCISSVVTTHSRLLTSREVSSDKTMWLIKLIAKEMFKRESSQSGFDFCLTEITERKVKNYTKSLIDRKLESNDLWKGYNGR